MTGPNDTPARRAYLALQNEARTTGRPTQELMQLYVLEAFLDRLSRSDERASFVLKGGVLLAVFDLRRPTKDVDLQAEALSNEAEVVLEHIRAIASIRIDDGVEFDVDEATAVVSREEDEYNGVRVSMPAHLDTANLTFKVDVSVGDPMIPEPNDIALPRILGGTIDVRGYPLELVHAEKIVTADHRGTVNTRWRDFVDVVGLAAAHNMDGDALVGSITSVAAHRATELVPLEDRLAGYGEIGQAKWAAWRKKQGLEDRTPEQFADLVADFIKFAGPPVTGAASGQQWNAQAQRWE